MEQKREEDKQRFKKSGDGGGQAGSRGGYIKKGGLKPAYQLCLKNGPRERKNKDRESKNRFAFTYLMKNLILYDAILHLFKISNILLALKKNSVIIAR